MANTKKGFIFYFDNYPLLTSLSMEQRGVLFSVLLIYADRVWRDSSVTLEEVMDSFPQLSQEARMACGFMGAAILRDTAAWLKKQECRERKKQGDGQRALSSAKEDQRAREDMERARRILETMDKS